MRSSCVVAGLVVVLGCHRSDGAGEDYGVRNAGGFDGGATSGTGHALGGGAGNNRSDAGAPGGLERVQTECRHFDAPAGALSFTAGKLLTVHAVGASWMRTTDWSVEGTFAGHEGPMDVATLSPDGTRGASTGQDGMLRFWRTSDRRQVATQRLDADALSAAFASDGGAVFIVDATGTISSVAWPDARILWRVQGRVGSRALEVSPTGDLIAVLGYGGVELLRTTTGASSGYIAAEGALSAGFAGSDARLVIALPDNRVRQVTVDGTDASPSITARAKLNRALAAPDGQTIAMATDDGLDLVRAADGTIVHQWKSDFVDVLAFSPAGDLIAFSRGGLPTVVRTSDGAVALAADAGGTVGFVWDHSYAPSSNRIVFARVGGEAQVWDVQMRRRLRSIPLPPGARNLGTVIFGASDELLVNSDQDARLFSGDLDNPVRAFKYGGGFPPDREGLLVWSPDGKLLVGRGDGKNDTRSLHIWSAQDGASLGAFAAYAGEIHGMAWLPDSKRLVTAGVEGITMPQPGRPVYDRLSIKLWRVEDGKLLGSWAGFDSPIWRLVVSPDGTFVAGMEDLGVVRLWSLPEGSPRQQLSIPPVRSSETTVDRLTESVAISPDGTLVAATAIIWSRQPNYATAVVLWRASDGSESRRLWSFGELNVGAIHFSPDGHFLSSGGSVLRTWCLDDEPPRDTVTP